MHLTCWLSDGAVVLYLSSVPSVVLILLAEGMSIHKQQIDINYNHYHDTSHGTDCTSPPIIIMHDLLIQKGSVVTIDHRLNLSNSGILLWSRWTVCRAIWISVSYARCGVILPLYPTLAHASASYIDKLVRVQREQGKPERSKLQSKLVSCL